MNTVASSEPRIEHVRVTEDEIIEFGNRWTAARMLSAGVPYADIAKATGASSRTIARVNQWLKRGTDGYRLALRRMKYKK